MNVFDLYAKISLDSSGYDKELGDAKSKFSDFAKGLTSAAGKVGEVLAGIGAAAAAGIGAAGAAITSLTKQSLDAVANYEQLVGGVDKIFGEASSKVQEYANEAYKTAGISANEYMNQVTSFSASLIQGLKGDTEQAAEIANMAVKDMADNANTYGTDIAQIQSNYQALAKQNYTLLDNLKLGYGGTKAEMARLLNDANAIDSTILGEGITVDDKFENVSFDQMIRAIHTIQEELKITGTTSKEASGTISGSLGSMQAAWQNFLTGTGSAEQFTEILTQSISNIKQNVTKILPRLTTGLSELVELIAPEIPSIIEEVLPTIITSASTLIESLSKQLPDILSSILPALADGVINVTAGLIQIFPSLITTLKDTIPIVVTTIMQRKNDLVKTGKDIIKALFPKGFEGITEITEKAVSVVSEFALKLTNPENINKIFDTGISFINSIMDGLLSEDSLDIIIQTIPQIIQNLADAITHFVSGENGEGGLLGAVEAIVNKICDYFDDPENRRQFEDAAIDILVTLGTFLEDNVDVLLKFILRIARRIAESLITAIFDEIAGLFNSEAGWMQEYLNTDTNLSYTEWAAQKHEEEYTEAVHDNGVYMPTDVEATARGMQLAGVPRAAIDAYIAANSYHYATGFDVKRPTFLNNVEVGENGEEVLLPLDSNTGWMDKLADKLDSRSKSGGSIIIESITINAPSGDADAITDAFVDKLDEKLRNRQITQNRGVGTVT